MARKYEQIYDGEPYEVPTSRRVKEQCCDCGLVHKVIYRAVDKSGNRVPGLWLNITTWRDNQATATIRRSKGKKAKAL